jgi:hypothetical protein
MAGHPLNRNRLQIQELEGMDKRKGGIWWIDWEAKVASFKGLQPLKVWKDIYRLSILLGSRTLRVLSEWVICKHAGRTR